MTTPHWTKYVRPDQIAECYDGVYIVPGLYEALWSFMNEVPNIPNIEDSGPHDHIGHGSLSGFWERLSLDHQEALVRLEKENRLS